MTEIQTRPCTRLVQLSLPDDVVRTIDRMASEETISRAAFIRRLLIGTARSLSERVPA
jgi:hypothetical protein